MKKNKIVEDLALKLHCSEKLMPSPDDVIYDDEILKDIEPISDLEQVDRDGRTLLINAAAYERVSIVQYLIGRGADVTAQDKMGFSSLHFAVQNANIELIKILLDAGADINQKNKFGNPPLMVANPVTHPEELYKLLLSCGADPNLQNNYGRSAKDLCGAYPKIMSILFPCTEA